MKNSNQTYKRKSPKSKKLRARPIYVKVWPVAMAQFGISFEQAGLMYIVDTLAKRSIWVNASRSYLAECIGVSRQTIIKHLSILETKGLLNQKALSQIRRGGVRRMRPTNAWKRFAQDVDDDCRAKRAFEFKEHDHYQSFNQSNTDSHTLLGNSIL